ncbi:TPA: hypothetical protein RQN07_002764 [Aeromonas dhakensis]|uniref:hypothetical protein n=1 Tax=Aeromonas TaxID=642 RepID=UPI0028914E57|nr:hypothetical protein [Aeromonas dhakensis]HDX8469032.1 hypothetical protein [Aeromonas dhakensis]HDZ8869547.1 hypothetical protein [Aeromonas dhakensis]HDZ8931167.1 hypothetical protein [Aeromonas dhakensis]HEA3208373.1 hypothetical protein [Aeromonas dhakensis]
MSTFYINTNPNTNTKHGFTISSIKVTDEGNAKMIKSDYDSMIKAINVLGFTAKTSQGGSIRTALKNSMEQVGLSHDDFYYYFNAEEVKLYVMTIRFVHGRLFHSACIISKKEAVEGKRTGFDVRVSEIDTDTMLNGKVVAQKNTITPERKNMKIKTDFKKLETRGAKKVPLTKKEKETLTVVEKKIVDTLDHNAVEQNDLAARMEAMEAEMAAYRRIIAQAQEALHLTSCEKANIELDMMIEE